MDSSMVSDRLIAIGYSKDDIKIKSSKRILLYTEDTKRADRIKVLDYIAKSLGGRYAKTLSGSSIGGVVINGITILQKPVPSGGSNFASLDARIFSKKGTAATFSYHGEDVVCKKFTSKKQVEESLLFGLRTSSMLGEAYAEIFETVFAGGDLIWPPESVPRQAILKLGNYIGELLIGWVYFQTGRSRTEHLKQNPLGSGKLKAFYLPDDPSFSGVDSFLEFADGSIHGVSSKFGAGAKASFFSNLATRAVKLETKMKKSELKMFAKSIKQNHVDPTKASQAVYTYGIYDILGISKKQVSDPIKVYKQAKMYQKKKPMPAELAIVTDRINQQKTLDKKLREALPYSISAFFNRTIAQRLDNDKTSKEQLIEILQGKKYYQANLDITNWVSKGKIIFGMTESGKTDIKVIGNKAANIYDVGSKQGWINYEIKQT